MIDPKIFDDLARRLADSVPSGVRELQQDLEKNFRAVLQSAFTKLELVSREEFDVQSHVLEKTRHKVDQLERKIAALEAQFGSKKSARPRTTRTTRKKRTTSRKKTE